MSTSCHQRPGGRATAARGSSRASSVTAPASDASPRAWARRWASKTVVGSRNAPQSIEGSPSSLENATTCSSCRRTRVPSAHASGWGAWSTRTPGRPENSSGSSAPSPNTWSAVTRANRSSSPTRSSAAASDAPFPSSHLSANTARTRPGARRFTAAATGPAWYPTTTTTRRRPAPRRVRTARPTRARPPTRTSALEPPPVTGARRSERPAARTTPTRGLADAERPDSGAACGSAPVLAVPSDVWSDNAPPIPGVSPFRIPPARSSGRASLTRARLDSFNLLDDGFTRTSFVAP